MIRYSLLAIALFALPAADPVSVCGQVLHPPVETRGSETPAESRASEVPAETEASAPLIQTAAPNHERSVPADSTKPFPKKMPSHSAWERVASIPGFLLYIPFWVLFHTAGAVIAANEEYDIIPRTIDFLTTDDGRRGVFPTYESRSGGGATYFAKDILNDGSRFNLTATLGLRGRQLYQARYRRIDLFGGALTSGFRLQYRNMSDENFFGIGPDAREDDETNFRHEEAIGEITIGRRFTERLQADFVLGVTHNIILPGEDDRTPSTTDSFAEANLPGVEEETTLGSFEVAVDYDGRNRLFRPSSGLEAELRAALVRGVDDDAFGFSTISADVTRYVHLVHNRILVLRVAGEFVDPLSDRKVPFYSLSELGRFDVIRGFTRGRFRDRDSVVGSVEYRYPVWRIVDALLFLDAGHVAASIFDDFEGDRIEFAYGGGFRVWTRGGTLLRVELGKSDDGFRFHLGLN